MDTVKRIVLVGGGSGGHFYPLMSIAQKLYTQANAPGLYYMGPEKYDEDALNSVGATFVYCPAGKRRKYSSILNLLDTFKTLWGIIVAIYTLYCLYPDVVVSKGGFTSVPVVLGAAFLNIPIVVHESDTRLGAANKLAARFARHIAVSFEEILPFLEGKQVTMTGIPVRDELLQPPRPSTRESLGINNDLPIVLVLGGSLGAERINQLIIDSLDELLPQYNIIHQTGKNNFDVTVLSARELVRSNELLERYRPVPFFSDVLLLNDVYHVASLVISRAGTGTIYEIAIHEKPSIIIPIPESVSHDQRTNAYAYARTGAAIVLEESNLQDSLLTAEIDRIMKNEAKYSAMKEASSHFANKNAAEKVAQVVLEVSNTH